MNVYQTVTKEIFDSIVLTALIDALLRHTPMTWDDKNHQKIYDRERKFFEDRYSNIRGIVDNKVSVE